MATNAEWTTALNFGEDATFNTTFDDADTFDTTMDQIVEVTTSDHRQLTHRDAEEQHPISAITSLAPESIMTANTMMIGTSIIVLLGGGTCCCPASGAATPVWAVVVSAAGAAAVALTEPSAACAKTTKEEFAMFKSFWLC